MIKAFIGEQQINELNLKSELFLGMVSVLDRIDTIHEKYNFNDDYFEALTFYFFNYENITNNMRIKKN